MKIYGYSNTWSVEQNETIDFKVHCQAKQYQADIVRLYQTDDQTVFRVDFIRKMYVFYHSQKNNTFRKR